MLLLTLLFYDAVRLYVSRDFRPVTIILRWLKNEKGLENVCGSMETRCNNRTENSESKFYVKGGFHVYQIRLHFFELMIK